MALHPSEPALAATGIPGMDDVLNGGFPVNRMHLIEGDPGAGKTTLAMQFLLEGARVGESGLYVTLSESIEELRTVAVSHGWDLTPIHLFELVATEESLQPDAQYTMYHPSEVELSETTRKVLEQIDTLKPKRVVFDSLSEMRLLAQNSFRYRRQVLALKQFFIGRHCTVLLLDDRTSEHGDLHLQSIAHGVVTLEQLAPEYGAERRRLRIIKMRGQRYRGGYHDFKIIRGGLDVFPRLIAAEHHTTFERKPIPSGIAELDVLVGGGLEPGTSTLLMGPAGTGKSTIALQYALAAARRGDHAAIFTFEEALGTMLARARGLGMPLEEHINSGAISVQQIDPAELSPGEFAGLIRRTVQGDGDKKPARVLIIDSLNGYINAMPEERFLVIQMHELLTYLGQRGVLTLLIVAHHGIIGQLDSPVDTSYLADTVLATQHFELNGHLRQSLAIIKKRSGPHEHTIREMTMDSSGIHLSPPLDGAHGILTGVPTTNERPT